MFHHPDDSKLSMIIKNLIFWISIFTMMGLLIFMFSDNLNIKKHEAVLEINIDGHINICTPDDPINRDFSLNFDE